MYLLTEWGKICGGGESRGAHSLSFTKKPLAQEAASLLGLVAEETGSWHSCELLQAREGLPVNRYSCEAFISRQGRIPAPIHSFKN